MCPPLERGSRSAATFWNAAVSGISVRAIGRPQVNEAGAHLLVDDAAAVDHLADQRADANVDPPRELRHDRANLGGALERSLVG
jgi:hypothetical protein